MLTASFEWFKERCDLNIPMRENQELLKARIVEAKAVGEKANTSRSTITYLKNSIEAIRRERSAAESMQYCRVVNSFYETERFRQWARAIRTTRWWRTAPTKSHTSNQLLVILLMYC